VLKGITVPPKVFQVERPTRVRGKLRAARGLTPFVGREEEVRLLLSRWERTREGEGQVALIIGEPGTGKSRLVAEFRDHIRDAPHIWMESAGEQFFESIPFYALIEMLSQWLQLQGGTDPQEQFERLARALASAGLNVSEAAPLIADLLQLPAGACYSRSTLTAEEKRRRLLAALSGWVLGQQASVGSDGGRRPSLARPIDPRSPATARRTSCDGAVNASLHSPPRVPRPMAHAHAS
jgi:AAA ATPase domain